ncbi:MAG: 2-C-methyl-D-erythritol 4-phosphate cytidylyltransferase [Planctomycetaceae bacterium]|jgi:2-C-methyl-D-erythritol 4-phosphate cytidylyltransferase|nr:2-C-methyl-D-erythritol 4-phosphate cytidylyltransferase [Planctomycetaceae bacterium]
MEQQESTGLTGHSGYVAVIIVAAGKSSRFRDEHYKKPFAPLKNRAVWLHCVDRFINRSDVKQVILVIAEEDREEFSIRFGAETAILGVDVTIGGTTRSASVQKGLAKVQAGVELIAVHDAARPCISEIWIDELFMEAQRGGAAILATPIVSTVKRVVDGKVQETVQREGLWEAQTPQVCKREFLESAYANVKNYANATDEAQLLEWAGYDIQIVKSSPLNRKITTQSDMRFVEMAMRALPKPKLDTPTNPLDDMWR